MRVFATLAVFTMIGGCSLLDRIELDGPPRLDPHKIYLGTSRVDNLRATETSRYACVGVPMICQNRGTGFDCYCP